MEQRSSIHAELSDFHEAFHPGLKSRVVDMSKLICEVWLGRERGVAFKEALKTKSVKAALEDCGIDFPENYVKFQIDTSTYNGSIEMEEDLSRGLTFLWKLPYAPWPDTAIGQDEIVAWIDRCDQWLTDPEPTLPCPSSPFIPLATT